MKWDEMSYYEEERLSQLTNRERLEVEPEELEPWLEKEDNRKDEE